MTQPSTSDACPRTTLFNSGWFFLEPDGSWSEVMLPHNAIDFPYDYIDDRAFHSQFTYRIQFERPETPNNSVQSLLFEAIMADARVSLNGQVIAHHRDGYTPFEAPLSEHLRDGMNELLVVLSGVENPQIPPFGGRIDYLTYAGIYRDVWLKTVPVCAVQNVKIEPRDVLSDNAGVDVHVWLTQVPEGTGQCQVTLHDPAGAQIARQVLDVFDERIMIAFSELGAPRLWDLDNPNLYSAEVSVTTQNGVDSITERFGFREAVFNHSGFQLNGRLVKLMGLNRHQSFPYIGYALGPAAQEQDAYTLKNELGLNLVRTSHYPQSKAFLQTCDEIGLMVFEELPGWQHVGDAAWQEASVENLRAMLERDWNHPSIILWGVRINESVDYDKFYQRTNQVCRELDPTRQTGGVRCITDSTFLEDVYTMNDFVLGSETLPGATHPRMPIRDQQAVTGLDHNVPYLITEYGGHMYPTQATEGEERLIQQVHNHLDILNASFGDPSIAGCIGWCFADYNTHKDFGSGDGICHHGVMDMFREPKMAAYVYASQMDPSNKTVLEPMTHWSVGGRSIGGCMPLTVLTNCTHIDVRQGDWMAKGLTPNTTRYPHLPHPPITVDYADFGVDHQKIWGQPWPDLEITGYIGNQLVASRKLAARKIPGALQLVTDKQLLIADGRDCVRIIARALDTYGNKMPFFQESTHWSVSGAATLIGPGEVSFRGGAAGAWVRSTKNLGCAQVTVRSARLGTQQLTLDLTRPNSSEGR